MKRNFDGSTKKSNKTSKKSKPWTTEEDTFLKEEVQKNTEINWKYLCKNLNKQFTLYKRTANCCKERWLQLNSTLTDTILTFNEEVIILLTFYRGNLKVATSILGNKVNVEDYIKNLIKSLNSIADKVNASISVPLLAKLQFFVCIDLALNIADETDTLFEEIRRSKNDWLEIVQRITNKTEKMTKEDFHQFASELISSIEERINLLLSQEMNEIKEIMHEKREDPQQRNVGQSASNIGNMFARIRNMHVFANFQGSYSFN